MRDRPARSACVAPPPDPGATNLVTGLVDAMMDSIPVVAITGQVSTKLIGTDAFQEADTFGITRSCTKHNFMVKNVAELPQIVHEAFYIAASGRPGPVLVDIPKDVFQAHAHYSPVSAIHLPGYKVFTEGHTGQIRRAAQMMWEAERPFVYAGGGIVAAGASAELRELVETLDAPAVTTLMGLGGLPAAHPNFISMPGMHGSYAANMGMSNADLLIALGVRFDDRVTGRLSAFAPARQGDSCGHRSGGDWQEPHRRPADRRRCEAGSRQAEQGVDGTGADLRGQERGSAAVLVAPDSATGRRSIRWWPKRPPPRSSRST